MFALLLYRLLLIVLLPILLLFLLIRSKNHPEYRQRLRERLGFAPKNGIYNHKKGGIVVHAASVGEVIALKSFIEQLILAFPQQTITLTTFTPTGSEQVTKLFGDRVQHSYLPLDVLPCTQLFLQRLQPKLMIFMETEIWPNLIHQCARKHIKLLLINGRLSHKSMNSYQKLTALITPTLNQFDSILCQSDDNCENFKQLGADESRCLVTGNLKFDIKINDNIIEKQADLNALLTVEHQKRPLWLMASTHEGDEQLALDAFHLISASVPELLLVIVPRHPERFSSVAQRCAEQGLTLAKRSENTLVANQQVWLLDTLGELMAMYALADIVTMGGSFSDIGGHNPLEPALFKKPIIVGSDMKNFTDILSQLQKQQGVVQLPKGDQPTTVHALSQAVISLLENATQQTTLGENAYKVVLANQGASARTITEVQRLINS